MPRSDSFPGEADLNWEHDRRLDRDTSREPDHFRRHAVLPALTQEDGHERTMMVASAPAEPELPAVGVTITEGMSTYQVIAHLGGTRLQVRSRTGVVLAINWADSGYRDPRNAWRVLS